MQLIPFYLFIIIYTNSMVISAPIKQIIPNLQETKYQKAMAAANRLLEQLQNQESHIEYIPINDDDSSSEIINDDDILPLNQLQLMKYFEALNEYFAPLKHTPIMADSIMKAEDH